MDKVLRLFLFIIFVSPFFSVKSQNSLPLSEITIKNGLSQGMIFDILQTQDGFMWFATKDGLNRYDGYNFSVFRHNPADSFSISDNAVIKLFEDKQHQLWVKTKKGLDIFDAKRQHFRHVLRASSQKKQFNLDEFADIEQDNAGTLWLSSSSEGVYAITMPPNLSQQLPQLASLSSQIKVELLPIAESDSRIFDIFISSKQEIYIGTINNCYQILPKEKRLIPLNFPTLFNSNATLFMGEDNEKNLIFLRDKHFLRRKNNQLETIILPEKISSAQRFIKDKENSIWFGLPHQLFSITVSDFEANRLENAVSSSSENVGITQLYCDKTGNIWIGTNGYGLRKHNPKLRHFHHHAEGASVWTLDKDKKENIYIKKFGGVFKLSPPNYLFGEESSAVKIYENITFGVLLDVGNEHWALISKDNVIEGVDNELVKFSLDWKRIESYPVPFPLYQQTILRKDKKGDFWFNTTGSQIVRFQSSTKEFKAFDYKVLFKESPPTSLMLYFDEENFLWIGTNNGLIRATPSGEDYHFELFQNKPNDPFSLPNNVISSFCDDPKQARDIIWVGTKGGGFVQMNKKTGKCVIYGEKQGLPNAVVYGILPDELGNLWLSTNRGIAKFNTQTKHFQPFTKDDGLQDNEFNTQAFTKSPQGELCFGGINGFNIFKAAEIVPNNRPPFTVIVGLKVNNKEIQVGDSAGILPYSLQTPQTISLSYNQNYLSISFAALDFTTPEKNKFRYILEGIDRDWIVAGNQSVANYTALEPGTYTFKVIGCNGDGICSETPASIQIVIRPPFWRTKLAYLFYILVIVFLVYKFYQYKVQEIETENKLRFEHKEKARLAALDEVKNRFYSNVTHEFRTPLTLILEPARQLLKELQDNSARQKAIIIENNSQKLLQLVNQLLDLSKLESGSMKIEWQYGNLLEVIQPIYDAFWMLAQKKGIELTWNHPHNFPLISFDKDKIEKILHNLLSNALKFTPKGGEIQLTTTIFQQQLQLIIKDSGIGIEAENLGKIFQRFHQLDNTLIRKSEGTGVGLSLVKELVELLEGKITVESELQKGTTFSLVFPLKKQADILSQLQKTAAVTPAIGLQKFEIPTFEALEIENTSENRKIILLIEDNEDMRAFIRNSLESNDYQVVEADNGQLGIEKAFEVIPDLVISDVMMPEKDGYELAKCLKSDIRTSHIPIILLTAKSSLDSKLIGLATGADEYIGKPFHTEEVLIRIEKLIQLRNTLQQKYATNTLSSQIQNTDNQEFDKQEESLQTPSLSDLDIKFLAKLNEIIEENLDNDELEVAHFTSILALSRSQLHRKMVALTNQSISEFIRNYRLDKAKELLKMKNLNVNEVAYRVGFKDTKYFSTVFKKRFSLSPSEVSH